MSHLLSVGIDIGTTTTQLVVSRLRLENVMPGSSIPHIRITQRNVVYAGQVHFTPLIDHRRIDSQALKTLISEEYRKAGLKSSQINTGAVIVTGETAKKENAKEIIHTLAEFAGDFVIATAGHDLEGIIAGKGSGAWNLARCKRKNLINVDIGGGTANLAAFDQEEIRSTSCLNIGGRLLEIDPGRQEITYITPPARIILKDINDPLQVGDNVDVQRLLPLVRRMTEVLEQVLLGEDPDPLARKLLMSDSLPRDFKPDGVVFSGGIGRYIYAPAQDWFRHGDIGVLLAAEMRKSRLLRRLKLFPAQETLQATVLGAGSHTVSLSGSTTCIDDVYLPIRNLPVVPLQAENPSGGVAAERVIAWRRGRKRHEREEKVAYWVPPLAEINFAEIDCLARDLVSLQADFPQTPLIVLTQNDIGKALGQAIRYHSQELPVICLDEIRIEDGDYIDIAQPLPGQETVPIVVKTLVFAH